MSEHIYLLTLGMPLATAAAIFAMRAYAAVQQAKAQGVREETLARIADGQAEIVARLAAIEKILKEVE